MDLILLTKSTTPVIGWIASLLGVIMNFLFDLSLKLGIQTGNVAISIILFTLIVNLLMLPLTIKQQKSSKVMNLMQPEMNAIKKKYSGKTDATSQQRLQAETKAVQDKYGYSMTGGCVQLLIQMPILISLYQVIYRIPSYVTTIFEKLSLVANQIMGTGFGEKVADIVEAIGQTKVFDAGSLDSVVDFLYALTPEQWIDLGGRFPAVTDISGVAEWLSKVNSVFGISLAAKPWQGFDKPSWAWLIPILAGVAQWASVKLMNYGQQQNTNNQNEEDANPVASSMKSMNVMMPLISVFFCFTFPAGIGIYWVASAVIRTIIQIFVNLGLKNVDAQTIVDENLKKVNAKRAKKGLPPKTIDKAVVEKAAKEEKKAQEEELKHAAKKLESDKKVEESTAYYNFTDSNSIAARANMVAMMNQREWEKKHPTKKAEPAAPEENTNE